jgi:hypothetical protein
VARHRRAGGATGRFARHRQRAPQVVPDDERARTVQPLPPLAAAAPEQRRSAADGDVLRPADERDDDQ